MVEGGNNFKDFTRALLYVYKLGIGSQFWAHINSADNLDLGLSNLLRGVES